MGTEIKRPGGGVELETDEALASEDTLNEMRKRLDTIEAQTRRPTLISVRTKKDIEANGNAHAAGDVISETDTASSGTAWHFENVVSANGEWGEIYKVIAETEVESQTHRLALQLYTKTPTCELDDNAAAASPTPADSPYFIGEIVLDALKSRGDNSYAVAVPGSKYLPLPFICEANSRDLWGVVVTLDATTHTATEYLAVEIFIRQY